MVWKAGESGNPLGSKPDKPITDAIQCILSRPENDPLDDIPRTNAQAIALAWVKKAKAEELAAITSLTDRVEGKSSQAIEHSGNISLDKLITESMPSVEGE